MAVQPRVHGRRGSTASEGGHVAADRRAVLLPLLERRRGRVGEDGVRVGDEDLDDEVGELDVHDGRHGFFFRAEQRGAEAHAEVADRHQVQLALCSHSGLKLQIIQSTMFDSL